MIDRIRELFRRRPQPVTEAELRTAALRLQLIDEELQIAEKCLKEAHAIVMQSPRTHPLKKDVSIDTFVDQCQRLRVQRAAEQTIEALRQERRTLYALVDRFENGE